MADKARPPTPQQTGDANSPKITVNDTTGALLLGLVALVLAFTLWRAQARRRDLEKLLVQHLLTADR